jgi:hypothetical protein
MYVRYDRFRPTFSLRFLVFFPLSIIFPLAFSPLPTSKMPWLGFSFLQPKQGAKGEKGGGSTVESPPRPAAAPSASASGKDAAGPRVRLLRAEEMEALKGDNAQLRALMQQLAEKTQQQQLAQQTAASAGGPSLLASNAASASPPPSSNPNAAAGSTARVAFTHVPGLSSRLMHGTPTSPSAATSASASAPLAEGVAPKSRRGSRDSLSAAAIAPVADFYSSLRASLRPAAASGTVTVQKPAPSPVLEESDDEWGDAALKPSASAEVETVHAAQAEDEAVVHTKRTSVVVHKKPLARKDLDDESGNAAVAAPAAKAASGLDDFDDDFGEMSVAGSAAEPSPSGDDGEEIAILDLESADWSVHTPLT